MEPFLSLISLMLRRCITDVGRSSISANKIHLGSLEMDVYINFSWLHCSISCSVSNLLCPITSHLHLCLCHAVVCKCWLLFIRFCLVLEPHMLWVLWSVWLCSSAGEAGHVYSRWVTVVLHTELPTDGMQSSGCLGALGTGSPGDICGLIIPSCSSAVGWINPAW